MKILKYDLTGSCSLQIRAHELKQYRDVILGPAKASAIQVSTVVSSEGVSYTAQRIPKYGLSLTDSDNWHMLTCFNLKDTSVTVNLMSSLRNEFDRTDDVFCGAFLETILLVTGDPLLSDSVIELFRSWGCITVFQLPENYSMSPGPYLFSRAGVFWAWRLFSDEQEAFVLSTIPSQQENNTYETLSAAAPGASSLSVAVPSRLYFEKSGDKPLAGVRVSVKDVFHLKGVHTGAGNRAYRRLYPASDRTSAVVQKVIDLGAIIVGKAKTAEFAGSQEVVGDWCDYSYAFNIRADGYLVSTGSSTGSASGLAAYSWLDFSIASDAGGSIRDPSVVHGIYGFRPTHDGSPTKDAVIPCPIFQVPGYMSRSSAGMLSFGLSWLSPRRVSISIRLWFPPEYYDNRIDVQSVAEETLSKLAKWLNAQVDRRSLEDIWEEGKPHWATGTFGDFFSKTFMDILKQEYWEYTAAFREDYSLKYNAFPYICKVTQWLWSEGSSTTLACKEKALKEVGAHNEWLRSSVFDEYWGPPEKRKYDGFDCNLHASLAGLPNVIVPVGQCKFHSFICQRDVVFPVSLSIVGPKDTDTALLQLVYDFLEATDLPTSVQTGANTFFESQA